jgi:hypothetical protein
MLPATADGTPTLVRRVSGLVQSGWPLQSVSLTSWRHWQRAASHNSIGNSSATGTTVPPKSLRQKNDESMRSKTRLISSIISQASQLSWPLNCRKRLNSKSSVMRSALKFMICWMCYRATLAKSCSMASVQGSRDKRAALTTWRPSKWAHGLSFIVVVWPRKIQQIFARHEPLIRFD